MYCYDLYDNPIVDIKIEVDDDEYTIKLNI